MGTIFNSARKVRVWLGDASHDTPLAFGCIQYFERQRESHNLIATLMRGNHFNTEAATNRLRSCMADLFSRKYWQRLWCVQEVMQGAEVTVHCGWLSLPFDTIYHGLQQLTTDRGMTALDDEVSDATCAANGNALVHLPSTGFRTMRMMHKLRETRGEFGQRSGLNLASMLLATRHCAVTDSRDRIFALLSIIDNEAFAKPFQIDYTITAVDLYSRVAEWYYTSKGLGLMSFATVTSQPSTIAVPSWAPNWAVEESFRALWDYTKQFCAGGKGPPTGFVAPKEVFNINGKLVDFISQTIEHPSSRARGRSGGVPHNTKGIRAAVDARAVFLDDSKKLCRDLWKSADFTPTQYDQYRRTIVANTHYGGDPAVDSDGEAFLQLDAWLHLSHEERTSDILQAAATATGPEVYIPKRAVQEIDGVHEIIATGRVFMASDSRVSIGWAPYGTRTGDMIVVFEGGKIPFVIRPVSESTFQLIGECYLHGIMFGEAWADAELREGFFKLV